MQPINQYNYNSKFESVEKQKKMSWKQMIVKFFALIIVLSWFWVIYYTVVILSQPILGLNKIEFIYTAYYTAKKL